MSASARGPSCARCGEALPARAAFCPACGTRLSPPVRRRNMGRLAWAVYARAGATVEALTVRSRAGRELTRLRHELDDGRRRRKELLTALGAAVYDGDAEGTERARAQVRAVDAEIEAKEREMAAVTAEAAQRIAEAQLRAAPTEATQPPAPPSEPPSPAPIPEPGPVPHTPPAPPDLPEPGPVPHVPPEQPAIPEPQPVPHEPPIPGEPPERE